MRNLHTFSSGLCRSMTDRKSSKVVFSSSMSGPRLASLDISSDSDREKRSVPKFLTSW